MATRKSKKKRSPLKKTATRNRQSTAKKAIAKKPAKKKSAAKKKAAAKAPAKKKALKQSSTQKTRAATSRPTKPVGSQSRSFGVDDRELLEKRSRSAGQSGDLQGLSGSEGADSESVDELLEEGNSFEAGIVAGIEDAGDDEEQEIHTHEVPEDDVPEEYLDKE